MRRHNNPGNMFPKTDEIYDSAGYLAANMAQNKSRQNKFCNE